MPTSVSPTVSPSVSVLQRMLPAQVRFAYHAVRPLEFNGVVPLSRLPRLRELMQADAVDTLPPVAAQLRTEHAKDGGVQLSGRVQCCLSLRCERCLQPLDWPFDLELALRLVRSEADERRLLDHCEPLLLDDDWLPLHRLIEDEILLALPMAPAHSAESCPPLGINR